MQTFMPLTQATIPTKGSAPDARKPTPEKDGDDFGKIFGQNAVPKKSEPEDRAENHVSDADLADQAEGDDMPDVDLDLAIEGEEIGLFEMPAKRSSDIVPSAIGIDDALAKSKGLKSEGEPQLLVRKPELNDAARADPKQVPTSSAQDLRPQSVIGASLAAATQPVVDVSSEATPAEPMAAGQPSAKQHTPMANIFGLQLHRAIGDQTSRTGMPMDQAVVRVTKPMAENPAPTDEVPVDAEMPLEAAKTSRNAALGVAPDQPQTLPKAEPRSERRNFDAPSGSETIQVRKAPEAQNIAPPAVKPVQVSDGVVAQSEDAMKVTLDTQMEIQADLRIQPSPTRLEPALAVSRPEMARHIGAQLAEVLPRAVDGPVELSLNPEELGKVRISLSAVDAGITMTVTAERPETIDLMRRHIEQLAQEFKALGYGSINFDFNQQPGAEGKQSDSAPGSEDPKNGIMTSEDSGAVDAVSGALRIASDSLDLRL